MISANAYLPEMVYGQRMWRGLVLLCDNGTERLLFRSCGTFGDRDSVLWMMLRTAINASQTIKEQDNG